MPLSKHFLFVWGALSKCKVTAGVELWDKLEAEVLKLCHQLSDAYKQDEKHGDILLGEGKIALAKLESMVKGAKAEKGAIVAILAAVS